MSYGFQNESYTMNNVYNDSNGANRPMPSAPPPPPGYMDYQGNYASNSIPAPWYTHETNRAVPHTYNGNIQQRIITSYPSKYAAIHSALLIISGVALICLNIAMLFYKPDMYMVPTGFVAGVYFLVLAFLTLLISKFNLF